MLGLEMERRRKISLLLVFATCIARCYASDVAFFESFDESFEKRWTVSNTEEYTGVWEHSKSEGHNDYGLLVSQKARKYGIVKELDRPLSLQDGTAVMQYEVRLQNGLECGGAYLKFLQPQEAGWTPKEFNNSAPYSIMFGPDKCGMTNKVHFIVRHKNPVTGHYSEHHLTSPPQVPSDKDSHVYTAVLKPGNKVQILIDGEEKKNADLLAPGDFDPPLIPSKTIPDPNDRKPEDWDEREEIPDETAVKPDDWDEDAPLEIVDEEAVKPAGWLDDEPEQIEDPDAEKPSDWDEDEDGEWEAPKIVNPKCELAPGCGEWTKPMKTNPAYKGKWHTPLIPNPNYKGVWAPKQIPNPHYFEVSKPTLETISAVGIEIWTMQSGILFDNILVTRDEATAKSYRDTLWLPKFEKERKAEEQANGWFLQRMLFELLYKIGRAPFLGPLRPKIMELIILGEESPTLTMSFFFTFMVLTITALYKVYSGYKKPAGKVSEKGRGASDMQEGSGDKSEGEREDVAAARKRSVKRTN